MEHSMQLQKITDYLMLYDHSPWDYIIGHNKMEMIEIIPTWNWKSIAKQDMQICKELMHTPTTSG